MANESPYDRLGISVGESTARQQRVQVWGGETLFYLAARYLGEWRDWRLVLAENPTIEDPDDVLGFEIVSPSDVAIDAEVTDGGTGTTEQNVSDDTGLQVRVDLSSPGPADGWTLQLDHGSDDDGGFYEIRLVVGELESEAAVVRDEDFYAGDGTPVDVVRFLSCGRYFVSVRFDADEFLQLVLLGRTFLDATYNQQNSELLIPSIELPSVRGSV